MLQIEEVLKINNCKKCSLLIPVPTQQAVAKGHKVVCSGFNFCILIYSYNMQASGGMKLKINHFALPRPSSLSALLHLLMK